MFGKLSFFKRASRSHAKTGLFSAPFGCLFPSLFLSGFLGVLGRSFGSLGLHFELILEPFLLLLYDFPRLAELVDFDTPLTRNLLFQVPEALI